MPFGPSPSGEFEFGVDVLVVGTVETVGLVVVKHVDNFLFLEIVDVL